MRRVLGLFHLVLYSLGMIVGAGIYSVIGKAAGIAGGSLWISFLIAAISAFLTALSYAELVSMFPRAGAEYIYIKSIFPKSSFLPLFCGTLMVFSGVCTAATVALAFSGYLQQIVPIPLWGTSVLILLFFGLVNIWGLREASWINILFTSVEILGLLLFVAIGLSFGDFGAHLSWKVEGETFSGAALIIFAYFGFESIVNFAEETSAPERKIPQAIFWSLMISAVLYSLVSIAALSIASPLDLSQSEGPLSYVLKGRFPQAAMIIAAIAVFSTANTVLISILSTSRIIFSMSREADLPFVLSRLTKKKETPWVATLVVLIMANFFLPVGGIEIVASASALATMVVFLIINLSLIHLRYVHPEMPRPFRVPGSIRGMPILPFLAALTCLVLLFYFAKEVYLLGLIFLTVIFFLFILRKFLRTKI